jgi:hypothetical protein
MKINSTSAKLKKMIQVSIFLSGLFPLLAHSYVISDLGSDAAAYWGEILMVTAM